MGLRKRNTAPGKSVQAKKCKNAFDVDLRNDSVVEEMVVQKTPKNKTPKGKKSRSMSEKKVNFDLSGNKAPQKNNSFTAKKQLTPFAYGKTRVKDFKGMKGEKKPQDEEIDDEDDNNIGMDDDEVDYDRKDEDDEDVDEDDDDNDKDDSDEDDDGDNEEQEHKNYVNTPIKGADKSEKQQTSKAKTAKKEIQEMGSSAEVPEILEEAAQRRERDLRTLFVGNLPANTTPNELKALSSDITEVIPRTKSQCFIRFASEEKADANYKALQGKELKGHILNVDYMGEKSKNIQKKETKEKIGLESLYVGNLPTDVTSDELKALSTDIKVVCLPKKFPNPLNSYSFITFASKEEAYANYKALQGKKLRGRVLKIQFARENSFKKAKKSREVPEILEEAAQRRERDLRTLFVGDLPANTTPNELKALSSDITEVIPGAISNFFQGYCFIRFASEEKADANYKALQGKELKGHVLNVDYMGEKCKNIQKKETKGEKGQNKRKFQQQEYDPAKKGKFTEKRIAKLKS